MRCASALLLAALDLPASADVYISTAPDGSVALTNVPADPAYRLFLRDRVLRARSVPIRQPVANGKNVRRLVDETSREYGLDPGLLDALVSVESGYDVRAVSPAGAMGLTQLMPSTARRWGVADPFDPRQNLRGGASQLSRLLQVFEGDLRLSLAAYNAGETAVRRSGNRVPCNAETPRYVLAVLDRYKRRHDSAITRISPPNRTDDAMAAAC